MGLSNKLIDSQSTICGKFELVHCPCDATYKLILLFKKSNLLIKVLGETVGDGSDYLVVGRPITQPADPVATLKEINDSLK